MLFTLTITIVVSLNCFFIDAAADVLSSQLGQQKPSLGPIKILHYEPTPEEFYHNHIWSSVPVLIRTNNPSWHETLAPLNNIDSLRKHYGETYGRAYKRTIWRQTWPLEIRLQFKEFLERKSDSLYWDSQIPLNNKLLQHIPLPLFLQDTSYMEWIGEGTLLYTNRNASSVFHKDGSENFFFQVSGQKTWLLAEPSVSHKAYANDYITQPGLSPVNPESVDLKRYPLVSEIEFYEITTKPGDMLYVPQYWWHQVRSHHPPVVSLNLWSEIFLETEISDRDIVQNSERFKDVRLSASPSIHCRWQRANLYDALRKNHNYFVPLLSQDTEENFPLYFGSDEGAFYVVNSVNGQIIWKRTIREDAGSTPVLSKDKKSVYFAGEDSTVYAYASESGELNWKTLVSDGVAAALRLNSDDSVLFVAAIDGCIYGINAETGKKLWENNSVKGEIWSSPVLHKNAIIVCVWFQDTIEEGEPSVLMLDTQNGKELWRYSTNQPIFSTPEIDTLNGLIYVLDFGGQLHILEAETGSLVRTFDAGDACEASPVLNTKFDKLYFVTMSGTVKRVDLNTFEFDWEVNFDYTEEDGVMSSPLLSPKSNALYVAIGNIVRALNAETGDILWEFHANGTFISSPRSDKNGVLYIGCNDNMLYAINSADGTLAWQLLTGGAVVSSIVMHDDFMEDQSVGGLIPPKYN